MPISNVTRFANPGTRTVEPSQVVASHRCLVASSRVAVASSPTFVISRLKGRTGKIGVTALKFILPNFYIDNSSNELSTGNSVIARASVLNPLSAFTIPVYFDGARQVTIPDGHHGWESDWCYVPLPPDTDFQFNIELEVSTAGQFFPAAYGTMRSGENMFTHTASQVDTYGALTGTGANPGYQPIAILGKPDQTSAAYRSASSGVIIIGDSNAVGQGDAASGDGTLGARGYIERGLRSVNGSLIPYIALSRGGDSANSDRYNGAWRRWHLLDYARVAIVQLGRNDVAGGADAATTMTRLRVVWAALKARGVKVYQTTIVPSTTSIDNFISPGGQTVTTGFGVGGVRDQVNTQIKAAAAAGEIAGVIDPNPFIEDQANLSKWITNGTTFYATGDGVHMSAVAHELAAPAINAVASKFPWL